MIILRMCDFPTKASLKKKESIIDNGLAITNLIPQTKEYMKRKHKVIVFSGGSKTEFKENIQGIPVYHSRLPRLNNYLFGFGLLQAIKKITINEGKPDILIIHNPLTGAGTWFLKKIFRVPIIVHVHGTFTIRNRFEKWLAKKVLQSADGIISISPPTTKQIISLDKKLKKKVVLIRNGVPIERFVPKGKIQNKVIFFGRDTQQKNLQTFLNAVKILKKKYPSFKFGVLGAEINNDLLDFSKVVDPEKVPGEIEKSVIVMPYLSNTFGKTTPEAMAMECIVVGTDTDIPNDAKKHGFFYDKNQATDAKVLAKEIEKAIKSNRKDIGKEARGFVLKNYAWKNNVDKQIDLINKILKN
jgi:glycosyltransferase involved in cell wall biosynthesis